MIDLANIDSKLLIGILTPTLLAAGYFYRSRKESIKNRKIALYILLEIWHRVSAFYRKDFDDVFDQLFNELKKQFPGEDLSESELITSKSHFTPILIEATRGMAFSDLDSYQEKYQEAVSLISSDNPIFAHKINSSSKTRELLSFLDGYLEKSLEPIEESEVGSKLSQSLKSRITRHAELDAIKDLESDIRKLSFKIGIFTYLSSANLIKKRKHALTTFDKDALQNLVKNTLIPAIAEYQE